jgi:hypothetical protein
VLKPNPAAPTLPLRQVHLDFHTSPHIPDVGCEFDPAAFVATLQAAHVNSVTVFARCHHGMCYYPAKSATPHPALQGRDMLGEMIEALHRADIRCPVYTTVAWDEDVAQRFPAWRMMKADGSFARAGNADHTKAAHPGGWHFNDFLHPDYQDYLEVHTRELFEHYDLDGLFYDIVFYPPGGHCSDAAQRFRAKHHFTSSDEATFNRFQSAAQAAFSARFARLVGGLKKSATVFFNSGLDVFVDGSGGRERAAHCSHIEIESLPSGFWGYHHFPRLARSAGRWGQPWIGMTGRFQKMWGDFGGIRPLPALEYDCFRAQAHGGGNSVGDQLPPRGTLDSAAYQLIGAVFKQCAAVESFYAGSTHLPQVGVLSANHPASDLAAAKMSDEGAILMTEETHYDVSLLDDQNDLTGFDLLLLPDSTVITPALRKKLQQYHAAGGRLILSHHAGRDESGNFALDFLGLTFDADGEKFPSFWRARKSFWPELSSSDRVIYAQGSNVRRTKGLKVLVDRVLPYFNRTDLTFSSHFQTPPVAKPCRHPAVVAGPGFVFFADPIFGEYRQCGNVTVRDVWRRTMEQLIGPPVFAAGLPTTILSVPRRRGDDLILSLLHYVPVRKSLELDVLEERMSFAGEALKLPEEVTEVIDFSTQEALPRNPEGDFELPLVKGRLLLEIPGYFSR